MSLRSQSQGESLAIHSSTRDANVKHSHVFFAAREQTSRWIKSLAALNPCVVRTKNGWIKRDCFGNLSLHASGDGFPPFALLLAPEEVPGFATVYSSLAQPLES